MPPDCSSPRQGAQGVGRLWDRLPFEQGDPATDSAEMTLLRQLVGDRLDTKVQVSRQIAMTPTATHTPDMTTSLGALAENWRRVSIWLARHAPRSYAAMLPPDPHGADALEAHLDHQMPSALHAWWTVVPGTTRSPAGAILPGGYRPLPARESIRLSEQWREAARRLGSTDPDVLTASEERPAGAEAWTWLTTFVPLAEDFSGNCLFLDLRSGEHRGCIKGYDHEQGALDRPVWMSPTDLLEDVATALEDETHCGRWLAMTTEEHELLWILDP